MESYLAMLGGLLCTGAFPATSTALAERAIIAMERQQWGEAKVLAEQALTILSAEHLDDYIMSPLVHTVAARMALHHGDLPGAREHLVQAARLRPLLTYAVSWGAVQTLLETARAYLTLDDAGGARTVLRQAHGILQLRPDLGVLPKRPTSSRPCSTPSAPASRGSRPSPPPRCACSHCCQPI